MWEPFEEYEEDMTQAPVRGQTREQHARLHALVDRCAAEAAAEKAANAYFAPDVAESRERAYRRRNAALRCEPLADGTQDPDMRDSLALSRRAVA